jgi:D-serine deaminase-like pyridoxal phosphate-dependent protein
LIDENRCKANIKNFTEKAKHLHIELRPHFKTHQSIEIGRWFRKAGTKGITVSTPEMASYFAKDGWDDFTIAFPLYPGMITEINKLTSAGASVKVFLNNPNQLKALNSGLEKSIDAYIELDAGYHRSGVSVEDFETIKSIISGTNSSEMVNMYGFYIHEGRTYSARSKEEIIHLISPVIKSLELIKNHWPEYPICFGDSPSCSVLNDFGVVDQISPGNFIFYDWMQVHIGSCSVDDIAIAVSCPLSQTLPEFNSAIIHGGAVHFSKDRIVIGDSENFGQCFHFKNSEFGNIIPDVFLKSLSQEHGVLSAPKTWLMEKKSGDMLTFFPVHSCLTANLFDHYITTDGRIIQKRILS